ncbi:uncharacterized protein LOC129598915 [Paramacrobiotus metropolitanus]|uniref:uncharacterized protein LOC129598915 n=1 Tax=Paramacrobiotus metropolitanus TaxID=2943436 RepID=UPI002446598A|nr:uncharacterized protein LOC129598915 [Paramacrobiotus metropolitanus]
MVGSETFLRGLCLITMMMLGVQSLQPLPQESSDWCANSSVASSTPPPPAVPTSFQLAPFPTFNCRPMKQEECDDMALLMIPECVGWTVVDLDLKHPNRSQSLSVFRNISLGIATVRADRPVRLGTYDTYLTMTKMAVAVDYHYLPEGLFIHQALDPIRRNIIEFTMYNCHYRCTGKMPTLNFSSLLSFTIDKCDYSYRKPLTVQRDDFAQNLYLRSIIFSECVTMELEPYTFTHIPDLRLLALEKNFFRYSWMEAEGARDRQYLRLRHCECEYAWLRDLFRVNPGLIAPKSAGQIYEVCQAVSPVVKREEIFVPIDCTNPNLPEDKNKVDWTETRFSSNHASRQFFRSLVLIIGVVLYVMV